MALRHGLAHQSVEDHQRARSVPLRDPRARVMAPVSASHPIPAFPTTL